ncbi:MAG TPA: ABC transporter [Firmicutes bacterium]|nr:ABC transporter [Bacillota bacterium]
MMTSGMDENSLNDIPNSIKKVLLSDSKISGQTITSEEKFEFLEKMSGLDSDKDVKKIYSKVDELPKSIKTILSPKMNMDKIKSISLFLVILYVLSALFTFIQSILMTDVANKFAKKLRSNISKKINKLPLKYFDKNLSGDILSRVTNDVDTIAQSMNQSLASLVSSVTLFIGSIIMMFYTNYIMAFTAILSSLIGFVFMIKILSKSQKYFTARQVELGKLNGHIEEIYSGLNVVKVYNGKNESDKKFDELNKSVYECNRKSQFLSGLMMPIMNFIGNFGYVAVCIVGALLVSKDMITFGVIIAFITYVRLFTNPLSQIAQGLTSLQSTAAASERVFEFLEEPELEKENVTKTLDKAKAKGEVEFNHVKFGYDSDKIIIRDFNAKIKPGQKVAIVGPTGAGKTTMVNLLMRFYEINSGDIKIDGVNIKDLSRENIHDLFTMVLQDTWLFNGTVKENIVYNNENVTDEEVIDVCKKVGVHHFIKTLPNGYDSYLSDIDSVSSGQRQLLTIARGMIDHKPLLILDEATSNVDTRTEELVQKAMDKLSEGKTSFIIAHRLSTIKNADLILVMKDGNIIEQGNHDELIKENGFYANLYNSQFDKAE